MPTVVPFWLAPDQSAAAVPEVSSSGYAARRPGSEIALAAVTETAADVRVLPLGSRATAVRLSGPLRCARVFQSTEYGAVVSSAPTLTPSTLNWTPATAALSLAFALTVVTPETVAPAVGAVIDTVGGVVSATTTALA